MSEYERNKGILRPVDVDTEHFTEEDFETYMENGFEVIGGEIYPPARPRHEAGHDAPRRRKCYSQPSCAPRWIHTLRLAHAAVQPLRSSSDSGGHRQGGSARARRTLARIVRAWAHDDDRSWARGRMGHRIAKRAPHRRPSTPLRSSHRPAKTASHPSP